MMMKAEANDVLAPAVADDECVRVLSIRQPWAWLIVHADRYPDPKRIENRTWHTAFRGRFLVHAGRTFDHDGYAWVVHERPDLLPIMPTPHTFKADGHHCGGIVGEAHLVDCVQSSASRWFFGPYGLALANARTLPFIPMPGKLGFFKVRESEVNF